MIEAEEALHHPSLYHIKKENIGLIEVMGLVGLKSILALIACSC